MLPQWREPLWLWLSTVGTEYCRGSYLLRMTVRRTPTCWNHVVETEVRDIWRSYHLWLVTFVALFALANTDRDIY